MMDRFAIIEARAAARRGERQPPPESPAPELELEQEPDESEKEDAESDVADLGDWIPTPEAAELLGVHKTQLNLWGRRGRLEVKRQGPSRRSPSLFRRDQVEALAAERKGGNRRPPTRQHRSQPKPRRPRPPAIAGPSAPAGDRRLSLLVECVDVGLMTAEEVVERLRAVTQGGS